MLRGFCMLAILLDHTEIYYTGGNIIDYGLYVSNALFTFFFLSGYLFYRHDRKFSLPAKLKSIFSELLIPYIIFTSIIAVPKAWVHDGDITMAFADIALGNASWFIMALIVGEILFATILHFLKGRILPIGFAAALLSATGIVFGQQLSHAPYQLQNGLLAVAMLFVGYWYHKNERLFTHIPIVVIAFLCIACIMLKGYIAWFGVQMMVKPVAVDNWLVFIVDNLVVTFLLIYFAKQLPHLRPLSWIGQRSIVYYFFCGGCPLVTSIALQLLGIAYDGNYLHVVLCYVIVVAWATIIAACIYRFVPHYRKQSEKF